MHASSLPAVSAALLFAFSSAPLMAAPMIAEFQAENATTIDDEDGDSSDWLEIFNPDDSQVDLTGMSLTDDSTNLRKWVFPAVFIPPKGSLLVWCSGKNRTNPAQLHTNFDLSKAGEYLALVAADGVTKLTEFTLYPEQVEDRSYGRSHIITSETPVPHKAPCRWRVPSEEIPGWQNVVFDDSSWSPAFTGIGYDNEAAAGGDFNPFFGPGVGVYEDNVIRPQLFQKRTACLVRMPFFLNNVNIVETLTLRMIFDDGFAAYLNGTRLNPPSAAEANAPDSVEIVTTPPGPKATVGLAAATEATFDLSSQRNLLVNGPNLLAIMAINAETTSSDMLMLPELKLRKVDRLSPMVDGYFSVPTPGEASETTPVAGFVDAPDFSSKRGFYTDPVTVTLSTHTPGATIRYTTNGTAPTPSSGTVYTAPVTISTSGVLRAVAYLDGWAPSAVKSHTYVFPAKVATQANAQPGYPATWGNEYDFFQGTLTGPPVPADYAMDPDIVNKPAYKDLIVPALTTTLPIMSISGDIQQIFNFDEGIYSNNRLTPGIELPVSVEFWTPSNSENWQENAGLRMHGGDAPLEHPKKPFRVYFRKEYGPGRLRQPLFPDSPVDSFDKIQLRPGGHDGWAVPFGSGPESLARHATYLRDRFLRQTELDMGRLSHRGRYAHLYINGLYWGFYDVHEVQSKEFFADHLGGADEDWDVVEQSGFFNPIFDVVDGTADAMDNALGMVRPPEKVADPATFAALGQIIDYNEFIDNLIVQMWGAQNDWMGPVFRGTPGVNLSDASRFFNKNWQAGRRSRGAETTGFFWQVWDAEISMGNSLNSVLIPTMRVDNFNHTLIGTPESEIPHDNDGGGPPGPPAEIYYALRKHSPEFRRLFADRLQKHLFNDGAMTTEKNKTRLQALRDLIELPVVAESARWGDVNTGDPLTVDFDRDTHWRSEMDWLRDTYLTKRNDIILGQFAAIGMWPSTKAPVFSQFGGTVPAGFQLTLTDPNQVEGQESGLIFYTLDGTDPMASLTTSTAVLLTPGATSYSKIASPVYPNNEWKDLEAPWEALVPPSGLTQAQELSSWKQGPAGHGFDAGDGNFTSSINTYAVGMEGNSNSYYIRIPFDVTAGQRGTMSSLKLRLKYDDGAYIFINGQLIQSLNANTAAPVPTSQATSARTPETDALAYQEVDLTSAISALVSNRQNVLAIQGLNFGPNGGDDDFLCVAELEATFAGSPPPGASTQLYTGPFTLPKSGTVTARILKDGVWSARAAASFIVGTPANEENLTITEFSYNPALSPAEAAAGFTGQDFEFIELMNISSGPVEMAGCRFGDGMDFDFTESSILAPGQRIVIVSNETAFKTRYPAVPVYGQFANSSNLSNSGERLELFDATRTAIFDLTYDDNLPWPPAADGGGPSLVLIDPASDPDPALPESWRPSLLPGGTPGTAEEGDSYSAWATRNGITGGMADDDNRNGLTNLTEYALGLTPATSTAGGLISAQFETLTISGTADTYLVLRYRRNLLADDVIITPEMSTDLITWTPMLTAVPPPVTHPDGTEEAARRSPEPVSADARVYVRLSVSTR